MRVAILLLMLIAASAPAMAEDFSGFYAGVNAGYGFERSKKSERTPSGITGAGEPVATETGLPPSARDAARALRSENAKPTR